MQNITPVRILGPVVATFFGTAAPLWAADAAQKDNSDVFIWIFLGFCALIVVAQLIPAVMKLLGFSKGVKKDKAPPAPNPVNHLT
jgi:hypothetical protein